MKVGRSTKGKIFMDRSGLLEILRAVAASRLAPETAAAQLAHLPFEDLSFAHIDHHRSLRKGFPEVIFGAQKTAAQIIDILERMLPQENVVLVTRLEAPKAAEIAIRFPSGDYHADARMLVLQREPPAIQGRGTILVITAGTSDIPVAREAVLTAGAMGNRVESIFDVGVAGIHRLLHYRERIADAAVLVVVAGMEGALPSVVAGMTGRPVIAVPTSVGYGVNLGGLTALFSMLTSCSSNIAVVNIDNGFGAGCMASAINRP
jgi:NCAIR mutase (PurE)-related protein